MIFTPEWADLANISQEQRLFWEDETAARSRFFKYYSGQVFKERVEMVEDTGEEAPLMYPVGINLVRMMCLAQADAVFGEWDNSIVRFVPTSEEKPTKSVLNTIRFAEDMFIRSNMNSGLWEAILDGEIYGGGVIGIKTPLSYYEPRVKWSRINLNNFFPVFDPEDPNRILESYSITPMTVEQAKIKFNVDLGGKDVVYLVDHWDERNHETRIDDHVLKAFSGPNPYGVVPYVYIPRFRTHHVWGSSLTEEIIDTQDELNARLADMAENINYNSHPIRWGRNLPRNFNEKNFPNDPNAMWNLGRQIGDGPVPEVGMLEASKSPDTNFKYINFLYDYTRVSSFSPPIVFGEDDGGGQRSGNTLEIRMLPLIRMVRRRRSYISEALQRALFISGRILEQKKFSDINSDTYRTLMSGEVKPYYAEVLPRDHQQTVDEVVKMMSTRVPTISIYTAVKKLGYGSNEVDLIKEMLKDEELFAREDEKQSSASVGDPDVMEAMQGKIVPQTEVS